MATVFSTGMRGPEAVAALNALYDHATEGGDGALALLNQFKSRYYGALAADPALDPLGAAVSAGDMYFNSALGYLKIYSGTTWERMAYEAAALALVEAAKNTAIGTTIPGQIAAVEAVKTAAINTAIPEKVAEVSAAVAATYVGQAEAARDLAQIFRDAALASGKIFTSTPPGITATATGQMFLLSTGDPQIYLVYENVATVATLRGTLNIADGQFFVKYALTGYVTSLLDGEDRMAHGTRDDGTFVAKAIEVSELVADTLNGQSVATLQTLIAAFLAAAPPGYVNGLLDGENKMAHGTRDDGTFVAKAIEVSELVAGTLNGVPTTGLAAVVGTTVPVAPSGYIDSVLDVEEKAAHGTKEDGTFVVHTVDARRIDVVDMATKTLNATPVQWIIPERQPRNYQADINHVPITGQSNSLGTNNLVISLAQMYDCLRFNAGRTAFLPLVEPVGPNGLFESPCSGMGDGIKKLILDEDLLAYGDQSYQLLFSCDGQGGTTIAQLSMGGALFTGLVASVQAAYNLAQAQGKTYNVPAFVFVHGESNYLEVTSYAVYLAAFRQLRVDFDAAVKAITGQTNDVQMIVSQVSTHKSFLGTVRPVIALAQLDASVVDANIHLAAPTYHLPYLGDDIHLPAASAKKLGYSFAVAFKRIVIDRQTWVPMAPQSAKAQGNVALVTFPRELVLDTTLVSLNTNYGLNTYTPGDVEVPLTSVTKVGPTTLRLAAASSLAGTELRGGFYGSGLSGPTVGPRLNIRDTQGDRLIFAPTGLNYPAHNWCPIFARTL